MREHWQGQQFPNWRLKSSLWLKKQCHWNHTKLFILSINTMVFTSFNNYLPFVEFLLDSFQTCLFRLLLLLFLLFPFNTSPCCPSLWTDSVLAGSPEQAPFSAGVPCSSVTKCPHKGPSTRHCVVASWNPTGELSFPFLPPPACATLDIHLTVLSLRAPGAHPACGPSLASLTLGLPFLFLTAGAFPFLSSPVISKIALDEMLLYLLFTEWGGNSSASVWSGSLSRSLVYRLLTQVSPIFISSCPSPHPWH